MEHQSATNHLAAGEVLAGKYRVERTLGMGGMGVVVAATHLDLREERAIKLVRPDLAHPHIIERFLREARAVVKLRSEHVAEVYDTGRLPCGAPYIVMELLHGEDLAALLKHRGTVPVHEAVTYVMQACDALSEAHGRGIVHRDLKPANLFLTHRADGSPCIKVLDFGVSKHIRPAGETTELEMTNNGDIMGSPLYMAPEQMRAAREVDARADIWALGAILYKLLTGKAPFQRATSPEIFMAVLGPDLAPLPSSLRRGIPSGLDAVIMRCLSKVLETRFSRAADLKAALSPYKEPREGHFEEDTSLSENDPRSSRVSNSSRPIPRNIDALLLGCIGKDPQRSAARVARRNMASDPFLRRAEPIAPAPVENGSTTCETLAAGGGTIPMGNDVLRTALADASAAKDTKSSANLLNVDEATALMPPRLPSFPELPPASFLEDRAPAHRASAPSLRPAVGEPMGNSVAPWDYALSLAPPPRRGRPIAFVASATTAAFIVIALVMAFTTGGSQANGPSPASPVEMGRPAAGGMEVSPVVPAEPAKVVPAASASAAPMGR